MLELSGELANELRWFFAIWAAFCGLCIGSFLNVVALRGLAEEEFVFKPSYCPKCKYILKWYNNIPVLSYLFQLGKCQACKCKISPQYPIVEAICGILFLLTYLQFGFTLKSLFLVVLFSFFILIAITDFKEKVVFDWHTYPIIALGLLYNGLGLGGGNNLLNLNSPVGLGLGASFGLGLGDVTIIHSLIGIALGFVFFEVLARLGYLFANSRAFGEGDTVIAMGLGAFFGWKILLVIIFASVILQVIFTIPLMFYRAFKIRDFQMCTALILIILSIVLAKCFEVFDFYSSLYKIIPAFILLLVVLLWCMKVLLGNMKNKKEEDLFYLPFGPALVICATFAIFLL